MNGCDVAVHGAGIVGRTLALELAAQGLEVALLAPATPATAAQRAPDLRAYALNAASVALLQRLRVWGQLPAAAATPVTEMRIRGDAPGSVLAFSAWQLRVEQLAHIVDAGALEATLAEALRYAPRVHPGAADARVEAPLHAWCDGRHSRGRAQAGAGFVAHPYGHTAVAARLHGTQPHGGIAHQWFRAPDVLALLPCDAAEPGCGWGLVWSLPQPRVQALLAADAASFEAALAEATGGELGPLRLADGGARAGWPLQLGRARRVAGPGWVLLGDAAHVVHPLAGQGLNLGLGDVVALARVLAAREAWRSLGDERLLARYARERAAPVADMAWVTDGLLHLFAAEAPGLRALRNRGLALVDRVAPLKRWLAARAIAS
jgi:2-polyprenyl-6-methoxyphenol hydroxylase-like FAD-dependent oxidoreductase